jgi:hypothetical protein
MQMIWLRNIPVLNTESLAPDEAREVLCRDRLGFLLYLSKNGKCASNGDRDIRLGAREALIWLNERELDQGSFWG